MVRPLRRILPCLASIAIHTKGQNISGIDPQSGLLTPLFHPRKDVWSNHFEWSGARLVAKNDVGRVTLYVLNINDPVRIEHRRLLMEEGVFPRQGMAKQ